MDEYDQLNKKSLKLKGEKRKKRHKSHHRESHAGNDEAREKRDNSEIAEDVENHGGWWRAMRFEHIRDDVAIEFLQGCYAKAKPDGTIVLGEPHPPGEGPDEEEIFTAFGVSNDQITLKSGFGRYLSVDANKRLMGVSEAVGEPETFLPVFEDNQLAICAFNECFLSPDIDADIKQIYAKADKVGPCEMIKIRINHNPMKYDQKCDDLKGSVYEAEDNYLKRLAKYGQDGSSMRETKKLLKKARAEGDLHEALLEKRTKLKSDKYCK